MGGASTANAELARRSVCGWLCVLVGSLAGLLASWLVGWLLLLVVRAVLILFRRPVLCSLGPPLLCLSGVGYNFFRVCLLVWLPSVWPVVVFPLVWLVGWLIGSPTY
jgi:hypothetical protein